MRPIHVAPFALALCLAMPLHAQGTDSARTHREAVRRYLEVTNVRQTVEQNMNMLHRNMSAQAPASAAYAKLMSDFYREHLAWTVLEPDFTQVYLETFTEPELRGMIAFYESPLGQTVLRKMPGLTERSQELTAKRVQAAMPQLMEKMRATMGLPPSPDEADAPAAPVR